MGGENSKEGKGPDGETIDETWWHGENKAAIIQLVNYTMVVLVALLFTLDSQSIRGPTGAQLYPVTLGIDLVVCKILILEVK